MLSTFPPIGCWSTIRPTLNQNTAGRSSSLSTNGAAAIDFDTNFLTIQSGAVLVMAGGLAQVDRAVSVRLWAALSRATASSS